MNSPQLISVHLSNENHHQVQIWYLMYLEVSFSSASFFQESFRYPFTTMNQKLITLVLGKTSLMLKFILFRVSLWRRSLISSLFYVSNCNTRQNDPSMPFLILFYPTLSTYIGHMLCDPIPIRFLLFKKNTISCAFLYTLRNLKFCKSFSLSSFCVNLPEKILIDFFTRKFHFL